ncbi:cysteinyl leukotriene receptor 2-like [Anneissia japonica]|uniref:cysteinyl leukotriene receptor 2-like n=1 Tax=Anneissia japonica TaxID=1529436 RepID=UPI001425B160|nr:cysteinyl leukotriene receptor 2-like [Anneissia japonica]XP_033097853.1 cysteinyl leukotriene receptor 2-like [Anneissia japonica]XP_033097854.1 cysteinyl leukotriene receptor 2-like [Anneissia japonica]
METNDSLTDYDPIDVFIDTLLYPDIDHVILPVIWPIIIIVGLLGNIATIIVFLRVKQMKTPLNVYLVSLAFSDSLFLTIAPILFLRSYVESDYHDSFDQGDVTSYFCKPVVFVIDTSFQISNFMILCVTAERYLAICKPFKYRESATRRRALKISLTVWILVSLYQSRLLISVGAVSRAFPWHDGYRGLSNMPTICFYCSSFQVDLACDVVNKMYTADIGVGILVVVIIVPMYMQMIMVLRQEFPFTESSVPIQNRIRSERKIFKTVIITVAVYVACFLPYRLLNLISMYYTGFDLYEFNKYANLLRTPMFINTAINPIIYIMTNKAYRNAYIAYFNPCGFKCTIKCTLDGNKQKDPHNKMRVISSPTVSSVTATSVVSGSEQC